MSFSTIYLNYICHRGTKSQSFTIIYFLYLHGPMIKNQT